MSEGSEILVVKVEDSEDEDENDSAAENEMNFRGNDNIGQWKTEVMNTSNSVPGKRRGQLNALASSTTTPDQLKRQKTSKERPKMDFEVDEEDDDEFSHIVVETSSRDNHGRNLRNQSEIDLLSRCIFCRRKTVMSWDSVPISQKMGDPEMLQVVPRAQLSISQSKFLYSFNRIWSDLQKLNGNQKEYVEYESIMPTATWGNHNGLTGIKFLALPRMCEFCAEKMKTVHRLYANLNAELAILGKIVAKSSSSGTHSWRAEQFERAVKSSNLDRNIADATTNIMDKLHTISSFLDPVTGLEDNDASCRAKKKADSQLQGSTSKSQQPQQLDSPTPTSEVEPNSPMSASSHEAASDRDSDVEVIQDEGHHDNQKNAGFINLRSVLKASSAPKYSSKRSIPKPINVNIIMQEKLDKWSEMEANKTFSKTIDPETNKEKYKCEIDGCGVLYYFWYFLVDHQKRCHNPNAETSKEADDKSSKEVQKCDLCKEEILTAEIYEHLKAHVGEEHLLKCPNPQCKHVYSRASSLSKHFKVLDNKYKKPSVCSIFVPSVTDYFDSFNVCQECGHNAETLHRLRTHLFRTHELSSQKNFPCPVGNCPLQFTVRQSVNCHVQTHDKAWPTQKCCECDITLSFQEMEEHLKASHGAAEIFKCNNCPFLFSTRDFMLDHLYEHKSQGLLSCDICGDHVKFDLYFTLREHYLSQHGIGRKHPCAECGHLSWTQHLSQEHARDKHGVSDAGKEILRRKKVVKLDKLCDLCDAAFPTVITLKNHKIQEHGAEPYRCQICNATFSTALLFGRHERTHGEAPVQEFRCAEEGCLRVFQSQNQLRSHVYHTHKQRPSHDCEQCGKSFKSSTNLARHKFTHTGVRPFICDVCGDTFAHGSALQKHKGVHSEERPEVCEFCGMNFRTKTGLNHHVERHRRKGAAFKPKGPIKNREKMGRKRRNNNT